MWYHWVGLGFLGCVGFLIWKRNEILVQVQSFMIMLMITRQLNNLPKNESDISINDGGQTATIRYTKNSKPFMITVPYDRSLIHETMGKTVYLIKSGSTAGDAKTAASDQYVDITQQPGVPYLVTAKQMGGRGFIIDNGDGTTSETSASFRPFSM